LGNSSKEIAAMKTSVVATLGAIVFAILFGAYLFAYATTARDPVEWKSGDLVVQNSKAADILPLFAADGSGVTHIGIVDVREDGAYVIEAAEKVVATPMRAYLARGKDDAFSVFRVPSLSDAQRKQVVEAASRQLGKPNDYFLRRSWDQLYSSELVRLAYRDIGFDIGKVQKLGKVTGDLSPVRSQFLRKWMANEDCQKRRFDSDQCWAMMLKQDVVTPSSIVADAHMTKIFEVKAPSNSITLTSMTEKKAEPGAAP
jgi:Permuted papain-like amidase enzyme, YaeF/YiiX, C92 family